MAASQHLNIIETTHISPPKNTVPTTTLPLTFFDAPWITLPLGESLFFYTYRESTDRFVKEFVPNLKHSLSITLQHFYPFAGKLVCPPRPEAPYLRYIDGEDSIVFTIVESVGLNFEDLVSDKPKDIGVLHGFLPKLPPFNVSPDGVRTRPAMVIQVTIFPGDGICIGNSSTHVAGDGASFSHFMKYWMSLCKFNGGDSTTILPLLPNHSCRSEIKDPGEVAIGHYERFWSPKDEHNLHVPPAGMVRATFTISRKQIDNLKRWVTERSTNQSPFSTFVVTLALTWVNLIKTLMEDNKEEVKDKDKDETFRLLINVDCRNRLKLNEADKIPTTYFGNCMAPGIVAVKKQDLLGENGVLTTSEAITARIKEMLSSDLMKSVPTWSHDVYRWVVSRFPYSISGAPKLGLYDLDFGMGKPCKMEIIHIEQGDSIAFSESRDGSNGVEIGLALDLKKIEGFTSNLEQAIKKYDM